MRHVICIQGARRPNTAGLGWIQKEMRTRDVRVSLETVRKWLAGEGRPRPDKMDTLAKVLNVDVHWLTHGTRPDVAANLGEARENVSNAAVMYMAGLIGLSGAQVAFVDDDDPQSANTHFFAIHNGRHRRFFVVAGVKTTSGTMRFTLPVSHEKTTLIGLVKMPSIRVGVYVIPEEVAAKFARVRGDFAELVMDWDGKTLSKEGFEIRPTKDLSEII